MLDLSIARVTGDTHRSCDLWRENIHIFDLNNYSHSITLLKYEKLPAYTNTSFTPTTVQSPNSLLCGWPSNLQVRTFNLKGAS